MDVIRCKFRSIFLNLHLKFHFDSEPKRAQSGKPNKQRVRSGQSIWVQDGDHPTRWSAKENPNCCVCEWREVDGFRWKLADLDIELDAGIKHNMEKLIIFSLRPKAASSFSTSLSLILRWKFLIFFIEIFFMLQWEQLSCWSKWTLTMEMELSNGCHTM